MTPARTVLRWLVSIALSCVLLVVAAALAVLVVIPRATHGATLTVLTGSMTPTIPVGSVVIDRPVDPGTLHVGDIATYQVAPGDNDYITHRIVRIDTSTTPVSFIFKGDANRGPDSVPVPAGAIRGKVWFHVPYLGTIRDGLQHTIGRAALIAVVVLLLGGWGVQQFVAGLRETARKRAGSDVLVLRLYDGALDGIDRDDLAAALHARLATDDDGATTLTFDAPPEQHVVLRRLFAAHAAQVVAAADETVAGAPGDVDVPAVGTSLEIEFLTELLPRPAAIDG